MRFEWVITVGVGRETLSGALKPIDGVRRAETVDQ